MKSIILLIVVLLLISCSEREHLNPFDPENPYTHGAPTGLTVVSDRNRIDLSWDPMDINELSYYKIYRSADNYNLSLYDSVTADFNHWIDSPVEYDRVYRYAIRACTVDDIGNLSDTLKIIPGPVNLIIADFYNFYVLKLSYDGEHILTANYQDSPIAIEANSAQQKIFIADYWNEQIIINDWNLSSLNTFAIGDRPLDMAFDPQLNQLYILGLDKNQILICSATGVITDSLPAPASLAFGSHLCLDPTQRSLWISIPEKDTIFQVNLSESNQGSIHPGIIKPRKIYARPIEGGCWVATGAGIVNIDNKGNVNTYLSNYFVYDISINSENGDVYYTGYNKNTQEWETGYLNRAANFVPVPILGNATPYLYCIQVIPGTGQSGFLVLQGGTWNLLRFDKNGNQIGSIGWFSSWLDIALD
jgi:hypothetical protein